MKTLWKAATAWPGELTAGAKWCRGRGRGLWLLCAWAPSLHPPTLSLLFLSSLALPLTGLPSLLSPSPPHTFSVPHSHLSPAFLFPWPSLSLSLPHVAKGPSSPPRPLARVPTFSSSLVPWHSTIESFKCFVTSLRIFQGGCVRQLILKYNSNPFVTWI